MSKQIFRLDFSHASTALKERYLHRAPLYVVEGEHQKDFDVIETSANAELIQQQRHRDDKATRRFNNRYAAVGNAKPLGVSHWDLLHRNIELIPVDANGEEFICTCTRCGLKSQETPDPCFESDCQMIAGTVKTHASFWEIK